MKRARHWACAVVLCVSCAVGQAADLGYLQSMLSTVPAGGWVKVDSNDFDDAWPTGTVAAPASPSGPGAVILAWSSFAWDSQRGDLILWGGGHANYVGNEVYVWHGATGEWTLGSLPSKADLTTGLILGQDAPMSSHTFATNSYAPINDRFVVFGGAAWPTGSTLVDNNGRTGPWWWNPALADGTKVGGATGTGWDPLTTGANAWETRPYAPWVGLPATSGLNFIYGASAYRSEAGKDVFYVTMDQESSGFPKLMRYELGSGGAPDTWQQVGVTWYSVAGSGAAMIDTTRGLFVRTAKTVGSHVDDLAVWNLANNNPGNPTANRDLAVQLVDVNGAAWTTSFAASIDYDAVNDQYVIWDGRNQGSVWVTRPQYLPNGSLASVWTVYQVTSATAAQPAGGQADGVLGKWEYVEELGAFIALDIYDQAARDAGVWLYKPVAAAVPEPAAWQALLAGLGIVGWALSRRRPRY